MQPRDYQFEAADSVFSYFQVKSGNPVIALPTGTGKSVVLAMIIERAMRMWANQRFMMLTHVKELVEQNAAKLSSYWPAAPLGIYSAGLRQRDTAMPIIFGGVDSVVNCVPRFGHRDLLFIDEAHLLSPKENTRYQIVVDELRTVNPYLKVVGLTATPFRLGQGLITDGGIFTDICCDMTGVAAFNRFIDRGYLAPLVPRRTKVERQSDVTSRGASGDFSGAALAADASKKEVTYQALIETCEAGQDCNSWLVFGSTIEDADFIADTLCSFGIDAAAVHSKIPQKECDRRINAFKTGALRCLVNMGKLTTGFDHPPLDLIVMLRRTMSPGLWVQMLGRGTRPSPETGKTHCLVLDFAGNTRRLGPINDPVLPRKKGKGGGDAPVRICETCGTYNHASARVCNFCGAEFSFSVKLVQKAGEEELIRSDLPIIEEFNVDRVVYYHNDTGRSTPHIKVEYFCEGGFHRFVEFVHIQAQGVLGKRARDWWRARFQGEYVPSTTAEALSLITQLRVPNKIRVIVNKKYPEVVGYEY